MTMIENGNGNGDEEGSPLGLGNTTPLPPAPKVPEKREHAITVLGRGRVYRAVLEVMCAHCRATGWYAVDAGMSQNQCYVPTTEISCWNCCGKILVQGPVGGQV